MDKLISEIFGFFLVAILMLLMFVFGALYYHVQQYNQFKNQCIEVVQRTGEMEDTSPHNGTESYLNDIADRYYAGYGGTKNPDFTVVPAYKTVTKNGHSETINESSPQGYGKPIKFYIIPRVSITIRQLSGSMFGFKTGQHVTPGRKLISVDSQVRSQGNKETSMIR